MFDLNKELRKFHDNDVKLDADKRKELAKYRDSNIERVVAGLKKKAESTGKTPVVPVQSTDQGGYAMHTLNQHKNGDYDIDTALIFNKDDLPTTALAARKLIADAINLAPGKFAKDPEARTNAVTVWYQEGYHVDLAIYRKYENDFGMTVIEHAGPDWTRRNPSQITDWFLAEVRGRSPQKELGATVGANQMRRIVRLLKSYAKSRDSWTLPGGLITSSLVAECYQPDMYRDDRAFYNTICRIRDRLVFSLDVHNPVDRNQKLNSKSEHTAQIKRLKKKLTKAINDLAVLFMGGCTEEIAKKAWKKVFNHDFWVPTEAKPLNKSSLVAIAPVLQITVGVATRKGATPNYLYRSGSSALPKNVWLKFTANISGVGSQYYLNWKVVNSGDEAEDSGDTGHVVNHHRDQTWESTAYNGCHKMICEVMTMNGQTIAAEEFLINIRH